MTAPAPQEPPRPTLIVAPPRKEKSNTKYVTFRYMLLCDNGQEYEVRELSALIGFKPGSHGLYNRIRKMGWDHPQVLDPPVPKGHTLEENSSPGNAEWERLSRQDRAAKLQSIPDGGTWELKRRTK